MIILTTPGIKEYRQSRLSSAVSYAGTDYILAEVDESVHPSLKDVDFWYELADSLVDAQDFDTETKYEGGIVQAIDWQLSLTKPQNIAYAIWKIATDEGVDPFSLWEKSIEKTN